MQSYKGLSIQAATRALLDLFAFYLAAMAIGWKIPFLAIAPSPYLLAQAKPYTLMIDF